MYGLLAPTSNYLATKINDEKNAVLDILSKLSVDILTEFKPIYVEKLTSTQSRPLKIIFDSRGAASAVLSFYFIAKTSMDTTKIAATLVLNL